jgi:hypothetical protein
MKAPKYWSDTQISRARYSKAKLTENRRTNARLRLTRTGKSANDSASRSFALYRVFLDAPGLFRLD